MEVALEIEESGSGARNDRPGLQRVLDAARRGQLQAVLCWKLDRFGRSALDLLSNNKVLEDAGVRFIAITQGIDIRPDGDTRYFTYACQLGPHARAIDDIVTPGSPRASELLFGVAAGVKVPIRGA